MSQTVTERWPSVRDLDQRSTAEFLRRMVEVRASLRLRAAADGVEMNWTGVLAGMDRGQLKLEIDDLDSGTREVLGSAALRATVTADDVRCSFETRVIGDLPAEPAGVVLVRRPMGVSLAERRRVPRRALRRPCEVTLDTADDGTKWQYRGALLNVSLAGLACRLKLEDAEQLEIGQDLRVGFLIGSGSEPFRLSARVATLTPTGVAERFIVGIEFIEGMDAQETQARLRAALAADD